MSAALAARVPAAERVRGFMAVGRAYSVHRAHDGSLSWWVVEAHGWREISRAEYEAALAQVRKPNPYIAFPVSYSPVL